MTPYNRTASSDLRPAHSMHGEAKCCKGAEGSLSESADLETIIFEPKPRSKTWLSTYYALDSDSADAGMCGVGYQVSPPLSSNYNHLHEMPQLCRQIGTCSETAHAHLWYDIAAWCARDDISWALADLCWTLRAFPSAPEGACACRCKASSAMCASQRPLQSSSRTCCCWKLGPTHCFGPPSDRTCPLTSRFPLLTPQKLHQTVAVCLPACCSPVAELGECSGSPLRLQAAQSHPNGANGAAD